MMSQVKWSPYAGMKMGGYVRATYLRGRKVFENGRVQVEPGYGQFCKRQEMAH